jgi:cysteinyl-tRNA synthetase
MESASIATGTPKFRVMNSLTKKEELFVPHLKEKNLITWYMCGPTVYDMSHMGHAKTYVQSDIVGRIMTDYFGYDLKLCMNITDVDDKIIIRSNEQGEPFTVLARKMENNFL